MTLSDSELLCAGQSGGPDSDRSRQEIPIRFGKLLSFLAVDACRLYSLHASEADCIVQWALLALFNPATARFDPTRGGGNKVEAYLRGLIQNAARKHARSLRRGSDVRHDYASPLNVERGLPTS